MNKKIFEDLAATTIFGRVKKLFMNNKITPQGILELESSILRSCGLSNAKSSYVRDLAAKSLDGTVQLNKLEGMTDQEIIDDLGIQKAMCKLYNLRSTWMSL